MQYLVDTQASKFYRIPERIATPKDADEQELLEFVSGLQKRIPFTTGLLPLNGTGLISYSQGAGRTQYVFQYAPGKKLVKWGEYENDENVQIYELAMPWYIIVIDFQDGHLVGARHFYSPEAIYDWSQQLYAVNLPNTNWLGYSGNSIGWICLYHTQNEPCKSAAEELEYALHRINGLAEPYNNQNMGGTDGPRLYGSLKYQSYMTNPTAWAEKTLAEGIEWILNPENLIALKTASGHSAKFDPAGIPYTLDRACHEPYAAYYGDKFDPAVFQIASVSLDNLFGNFTVTEKKKSPLEIIEQLGTNPFIIDGIAKFKDLLEDQKTCGGCGSKYKLSVQFTPVYTSWSHIIQEGDHYDVNDPEASLWCQDCINEWAVRLDQFNAYFATESLTSMMNEHGNHVYDVFENSFQCPYCDYSYTFNGYDANIVYLEELLNEERHVTVAGCRQCIDSGEIVAIDTAPDSSQKWWLKECCDVFEIKELHVINNVLELKSSNKYRLKSEKIRQCQCGFLLDATHATACNLDDENRCGSCVNATGEYTPVIVWSDMTSTQTTTQE